ncbi:endonuclease/exonuclease/phosphatase family protein [Lutibacter profundi]|nr:endonuclease/exonuclease/phosphatase family protein [Lutibacter profundi]
MSFNIRYDNPNDNQNSWKYRKKEITDMINYYSPEVLGIQEGLGNQVKYLDSVLVDYDYVGVGRDDGKSKGEYTAIFYRKEKIKLISTKTYWLSENPDSVSIGWDASMNRIVTFGEFLDIASQERLEIFNCHFDHIGKISQKKSAELILQIIEDKKIESNKIIVMGDFNNIPESEPIKILQTKLKDSFKESKLKPYGPIGTFNGFDLEIITEKRIDYILTNNIKILKYANIDDRRTNNMYLSDHFPILITIE